MPSQGLYCILILTNTLSVARAPCHCCQVDGCSAGGGGGPCEFGNNDAPPRDKWRSAFCEAQRVRQTVRRILATAGAARHAVDSIDVPLRPRTEKGQDIIETSAATASIGNFIILCPFCKHVFCMKILLNSSHFTQ